MRRLEHSISLALVVVFTTIFAAQIIIKVNWTIPQLLQLEAVADAKDKQRLDSAIQSVYQKYALLCYDNAIWDDAFYFMQNHDLSFVTRNFEYADTFISNGLNGISFFDNNGQLVWGKVVELPTAASLELAWSPGSEEDPLKKILISPSDVANNQSRPIVKRGSLNTTMGPLIYAATSILPTKGYGSSNGTLIFWRFWDTETKQSIAESIGLQFELHWVLSDTSSNIISLERHKTVDHSGSIDYRYNDSMIWLHREHGGNTVFLVELKVDPRSFDTGWFEGPILISIIIAMLAILALRQVIKHIILTPIDQLRNHMKKIQSGSNYNYRINSQRTDELGYLSQEYDRLLEHITLQEKALINSNKQLKKQADTDALTDIANRRALNQFLKISWIKAISDKSTVALCMCDIDYFKLYNDNYGHQKGDLILKIVASHLDQLLHRATDLLARYGGEEFIVVLTQTNVEGAVQVAENLRKAVEGLRMSHSFSRCSDYITLSIGVAAVEPYTGASIDSLITLADRALYEAKHQGRNRAIPSK